MNNEKITLIAIPGKANYESNGILQTDLKPG